MLNSFGAKVENPTANRKIYHTQPTNRKGGKFDRINVDGMFNHSSYALTTVGENW